MLKLYKDWFLDADPYQYIVGKVKDRTRDGKTAQEFINPSYHPTIAAAVGHVLEAEMRGKVADGSLLDFAEAVNYYSDVADDLLAEIESIPGNLTKTVKAKAGER